jgi:hypothetical protein
LNKEKMAGIVALAMLLVSLVGIQQGYATRGADTLTISGLIESVLSTLSHFKTWSIMSLDIVKLVRGGI